MIEAGRLGEARQIESTNHSVSTFMAVRGLRGAINAPENTAAGILEATRELLQEIIRANPLAAVE